jgi:ferritin-like metal-binding protein YciE
MSADSLHALYLEELRDLFDAEHQITRALPTMVGAASSPELARAFSEHLDQTRIHIERLELIFKQLNQNPTGQHCRGMEGLIAEGQDRIDEGVNPEVLDAALIAAAQRIEHYEIAAYGCARTYARLMNLDEDAELLQRTLNEEGEADRKLTDLAERGINEAAAPGAETVEADRRKLRYVRVGDLESRLNVTVRNNADEPLGSLEGFIVDPAGNRPLYYVIDAAGWFSGGRYLLPVGLGQLEDDGEVLRVHLNKDDVKRHPAFDADAFQAMSEEESREFERRSLRFFAPDALAEASEDWDYESWPQYGRPDWLMTGTWLTDRDVAAAFGESRSRSASAETQVSVPARDPVLAKVDEETLREAEHQPGEFVRGAEDRAGSDTETERSSRWTEAERALRRDDSER